MLKIKLIEGEQLKPLPECQDYLVSNECRVWSIKDFMPLEMKLRINHKGLLSCNIQHNSFGKVSLYVHEAVLDLFGTLEYLKDNHFNAVPTLRGRVISW